VKLWKVSNKYKIDFRASNKTTKNDRDLEMPKRTKEDSLSWQHTLKRTYPALHKGGIHSVSVLSNGENFLTADEYSVNYWNIENTMNSFSVLAVKKSKAGEEFPEMLTTVKAHPLLDTMFAAGTTRASIRCYDMRVSTDYNDNCLVIDEPPVKNSEFAFALGILTDIEFTKNGKYIVTRDFVRTKVYDIAMPNKPITNFRVYDSIMPKLSELHENYLIPDSFKVATSSCSNFVATGMYNNNLHIADINTAQNYQYQLNSSKKTICRLMPVQDNSKQFEPLPENYNYNRKVLKVAWHPKSKTVAAAVLGSLYMLNSV